MDTPKPPEPHWTTPRDTTPKREWNDAEKPWKDMTPAERQREIECLKPKGTRP